MIDASPAAPAARVDALDGRSARAPLGARPRPDWRAAPDLGAG